MNGAEVNPRQYYRRRDSERRRLRWVLLPALAVSIILHIVALVGLEFRVETRRTYVLPAPPRIIEFAPIMRAYDLVTVTSEAPPIDAQIRERQEVRVAEQTTVPSPAAETPAYRPPVEREPSAPVHERLRYRLGSTRELWEPAPPAMAGELSPAERVDTRIASRLDEINDSISAEQAARERATDWTRRDGNGGRWGVSPGKIHLGSVTLPLPVAFVPAAGRREEFAGRVRDWTEIQAQAVREEGREITEQRIRAIRERREAERRARMAADTLVATPPRPPGGG